MSFEPKIIKANVFKDSRGYFSEILKDYGFAQINMSWSIGGTFRGIHAQRLMDKAMWIASGKAIVYAVNLDPSSILYGKVFFAPWWWGRGFLALEDTTVTYATTDVYRPEHETGISYIGLADIEKDLERVKAQLLVSDKDKAAPSIKTEGTSENLANWKRAGDDLSLIHI